MIHPTKHHGFADHPRHAYVLIPLVSCTRVLLNVIPPCPSCHPLGGYRMSLLAHPHMQPPSGLLPPDRWRCFATWGSTPSTPPRQSRQRWWPWHRVAVAVAGRIHRRQQRRLVRCFLAFFFESAYRLMRLSEDQRRIMFLQTIFVMNLFSLLVPCTRMPHEFMPRTSSNKPPSGSEGRPRIDHSTSL
jgi:hypothetical protein